MSIYSSMSNGVAVSVGVALFAASPVAAQSLASRVTGAADGRVQFSFAARAGVCGNGRTYYSSAPGEYTGFVYPSGTGADMRAESCVPGPVRVVIDRADHLPLSIQTYVGPADSALTGVTDLGTVPAREAVDYLLSLARTADGRAGRDAIAPAMLADDANTASSLVAIARNTALPRETRRRALDYMGRSTDAMSTIPASVTEPILAIARDDNDNQSVRQGALAVLARLAHGAGIPPLIQLSQDAQNAWLARQAMQTLASSGDPRARQYLRTAVRRIDLADDVLRVALRALGQQYATAEDAALLRDVYPTLHTDASRESVLSALAEMGGRVNTEWLVRLAENGDTPLATRRRALDAANRAGAPIAELIELYDTTTDPGMKQALIGLYVRNGERPAIDKLLSILEHEENVAVRRNAIAQLARSSDPRVKQALQNLVIRGN
jgi:HEAT repeat protein